MVVTPIMVKEMRKIDCVENRLRQQSMMNEEHTPTRP